MKNSCIEMFGFNLKCQEPERITSWRSVPVAGNNSLPFDGIDLVDFLHNLLELEITISKTNVPKLFIFLCNV